MSVFIKIRTQQLQLDTHALNVLHFYPRPPHAQLQISCNQSYDRLYNVTTLQKYNHVTTARTETDQYKVQIN